jgi:hypothetical protein
VPPRTGNQSKAPRSGAWLPLTPSPPTSEQGDQPPSSRHLPKLPPLRTEQPKRILDFDIETRRIGFHSAGKFSPDGCEPVAIACGWADEKKVHVWTLTEDGSAEMLAGFRRFWDEAGIVTGHYIRKFDLPIINGALLEHRLPMLTPKLSSDTHGDFVRVAGLSKSQENLSLMLRTGSKKVHMADDDWRKVARLERDAMIACRRRVVGDVRQHKIERLALIARGALKGPRMWKP